MKLLILGVLLVNVALIMADKEEDKVPSLIESIKGSFKQMSKSYDKCEWKIEGGEAGLEKFYKQAFEEYRANKEGSKTVFSCTLVKDGRFNGDYLQIEWGPKKPPTSISIVG
ncbi:unnamed protein product [Bursaphelenchus xylophilus]|uniref:(pine wood nematode) hypothetical protein n=1 Tax=Bursaphelenchus xylophilus TaxID=6326 RepID=A0A1I7SQW8_BURXY|nr:unnamed protein product [Bursaphelenchus xylophilus]CAG9110496.1 unnamed protein product [Bursaphelenchus xylophilus]